MDDRSIAGVARLELIEDSILSAGDIRVVGPPPNDIHQVTILADNHWTLTITPGLMSVKREYYDLATDSYVEQAAFA